MLPAPRPDASAGQQGSTFKATLRPGKNPHLDEAVWHRAERAIMLGVLAVGLVATPLAGFKVGINGVISCWIAVAIAGGATVLGLGANRWVRRYPQMTMTIMLGSYLVKLLLVALALILTKSLPVVHTPTLFTVLLIQILLVPIIESKTVIKAKPYYLETKSDI